MKTLHIIAGYSAGNSLKTMLAEQKLTASHEVLVFWDDLSIGPLFDSVSADGLKPRIDYFKNLYQGDPDLDHDAYYQSLIQHIRDFHDFHFNDYATIIIWHSRTAAERLLFDWVCELCKDYEGTIENVDVKGEAFKQFDYRSLGLGYLSWQKLAQCWEKYRQPTHPRLVKIGAKRWRNQSPSLLRICSVYGATAIPETFFDDLILSCCHTHFQRSIRVVGDARAKLNYPVSVAFITYRLHTLIANQQLIADHSEHFSTILNTHIKLPTEIKKEKVLHVIRGEWAQNLHEALVLKGLADSHRIVGMRDDFSVGQLPADLSVQNLKKRGDWWQQQYCGGDANDYVTSMQDFLSTPFADYDKVVIWHGATVQDQLLLCLMHYIYGGDLHEIRVTGNMYDGVALTLAVLSPIEVTQKLPNISLIDKEHAEFYRQQWQYWSQSTSVLRIMQDDHITAVAEDHFDDFILSYCKNEWQAAARVVGNCIGYCNQYLSDGFFTTRLQHLVTNKKIQAKGNTAVLRKFQVRLPQT